MMAPRQILRCLGMKNCRFRSDDCHGSWRRFCAVSGPRELEEPHATNVAIGSMSRRSKLYFLPPASESFVLFFILHPTSLSHVLLREGVRIGVSGAQMRSARMHARICAEIGIARYLVLQQPPSALKLVAWS